MTRLELIQNIASELTSLAKDFPELLPIVSMRLVIADRAISACEKAGMLAPLHPEYIPMLNSKAVHETINSLKGVKLWKEKN